jgi:hypothetical protein
LDLRTENSKPVFLIGTPQMTNPPEPCALKAGPRTNKTTQPTENSKPVFLIGTPQMSNPPEPCALKAGPGTNKTTRSFGC